MARSKKDKEAAKRARQAERHKTDATPAETRRMGDAVLARMLEEHMIDSLGEIAETYQRLTVQLGFKTMQFGERIPASSGGNNSDKALQFASVIVQWRHQCTKRRLDPRGVMLLVSDGASISGLMRAFKTSRPLTRLQLRACLAVWSLIRHRCNEAEVSAHSKAVSAHCSRAR